MFKRIMVAIDDEKVSQLALKTAIDFAKEQKAKLCLVHVLDYSSLVMAGEGIDFEVLRKNMKKEGESIIAAAIAMAKKKRLIVEAKLVEPKNLSLKTDIASVVIKTAKRWRTHLLVVGSHGYRGVSRLVLGSMTEEMIKSCSIPLLIVRAKKR